MMSAITSTTRRKVGNAKPAKRIGGRNSAGAGSVQGSPVQISRHRSAMMKETPSVTSTWPCTLPASRRRMKRSKMIPSTPTPSPAPSTASQKLPPNQVIVAPR